MFMGKVFFFNMCEYNLKNNKGIAMFSDGK